MRGYSVRQGPDGLYDVYKELAGGGEKCIEWGFDSLYEVELFIKQLKKGIKVMK